MRPSRVAKLDALTDTQLGSASHQSERGENGRLGGIVIGHRVVRDMTEDARTGAQLIDARIAALGDWRGETLAHIRAWIIAADPQVIEEIKWRKPTNPAGVPVWSHAGILCTGETYRDKVKLTFAKGALLADPSGLFNASLDGNIRRAIDIGRGGRPDEAAFTALIGAAVALNLAAR